MASTSNLFASAQPAWHTIIAARLAERDAKEQSYDHIISSYQRLSAHTRDLRAQVKAAAAGGSLPSSSSPSSLPVVAALKSTSSSRSLDVTSAGSDDARVSSLTNSLTAARAELAELYKTQSANAQRLLTLTDALAAREASARANEAEAARAKEELSKARRRDEDGKEAMKEKERLVEMLQDELSALSLELNQVEARNDALKKDNASLLQRWLDRMNDEAERMNLSTDEEHRRAEEARKAKETTPTPTTATEDAEGTPKLG